MRTKIAIIAILICLSYLISFGKDRESDQNSSSSTGSIEKDSVSSLDRQIEQTTAIETLDNWLSISLEEEIIIKKLGNPEKGPDKYSGALGTYIQEWSYPSIGLKLQMESEKKGDQKFVSEAGITIEKNCSFKTSKGVGIGDHEEDVFIKYSSEIDSSSTIKGRYLVVGSIYGGTIFSFEDGRVSKIFIGAAAE